MGQDHGSHRAPERDPLDARDEAVGERPAPPDAGIHVLLGEDPADVEQQLEARERCGDERHRGRHVRARRGRRRVGGAG